jgi:hypothetical protein
MLFLNKFITVIISQFQPDQSPHPKSYNYQGWNTKPMMSQTFTDIAVQDLSD